VVFVFHIILLSMCALYLFETRSEFIGDVEFVLWFNAAVFVYTSHTHTVCVNINTFNIIIYLYIIDEN